MVEALGPQSKSALAGAPRGFAPRIIAKRCEEAARFLFEYTKGRFYMKSPAGGVRHPVRSRKVDFGGGTATMTGLARVTQQ